MPRSASSRGWRPRSGPPARATTPLSCADLIRAAIYQAARSSVSPRRTGLRIQEPPDQEALHVTAAIGNQIDDHTPLLDAIDQPVGLEEDLAKLGDAEVGKLARMAPALRKLGKVDQRLFDAFENIGRALARIVLRDIAAGVVEVTQGIVCEDNAERHQSAYFLRREAIASVAVWIRPSSTCRLPSARILRRARVSCVCS